MSDSDDDSFNEGTIDPVRPWTIRAISVEVRDMAITAGRKEQMSVGQWLERLIRRECEAPGTTIAVSRSTPPVLPALATPGRTTKLDRIKGIATVVAELGQAGVKIDDEHARRVTEALIDALPTRKRG